jgi:hypothetical protein
MIVYLVKSAGRIALVIRAEGDGTIGDAEVVLEPDGKPVLGRTYEEWSELEPGPYEVE